MGSIAALPSAAARSCVALAAALAIALSGSAPARAQNVPLVRDAEIEALVRDYARPILKAAGLSKSGIEVVLVNDQRFNAFVLGRRMFINTGALVTTETPNEIIGVIAHEAGHIAGGHQERLRDQLARAQTMAIIGTLLGVGAVLAGAATDNKGLAAAGSGLATGGPEAARRGLLSYQRTEEVTADRSALTYLNATGQSAAGMLKTFERFQSALALSGARIDPYQASHPMPRERIANLQVLAQESPYFGEKDPADLQLRHDLMRAKIAVFTQGHSAAQRIFRKDPKGLPAQYGDAIAAYLKGDTRSALKKADALIKLRPNYAYFHELRGDTLMKANRASDAVKAYQTAIKLDPSKSTVLRVLLGQALLANGGEDNAKKAVQEISSALERDKDNISGYRYLAQAYGQLGEVAMADLSIAEGYFYSASYQDAKQFAMRAQQKMKRGSPGWLRAQDILQFKAPKKK